MGPSRMSYQSCSCSGKKGELTKVRPVLDFRWLNARIKSRPSAATPLCQEKLRQWRRLSNECAVVDLRKACLQLHLDPALWAYQAIVWKGHTYLLTRVGFELSIAPKVMTAVVERVLSEDSRIAAAASSYIDDIMVEETKIGVSEVIRHLARFGLTNKAPEQLDRASDVRVLGLKVASDLSWKRDSPLPSVSSQKLKRRQVH